MKAQHSRTMVDWRRSLENVLVPRSSTALWGILAVTFGCLGACARDTSALSSGSGSGKGGKSSTDNTGGASTTGGSAAGGLSTTTAGSETTGGLPGSAGASAFGGAGGGSTDVTSAAGSAGAPLSPIAEAVDVGPTYSGQPTEMSLTTIGNQQFVAYWGADKRMTVASRMLGETTWKRIALAPSILNDGHHSIVLAADKKGYLHLSGRMHNEPLTYLRSTVPMDISTFQLQMNMVAGTPEHPAQEERTTYPRFFIGPIGDLIYSYRYGESGQGDTIFNVYDATSKTWTRLLGTKLIDGQSQNSAYIVGPTKGPDDYWHMVWTWRVDANAETNHDLSYARSKDFLTWETGTGAPLALPITLGTADIVDPVPTNGGMINNNTKVGFDSQNRPVIVYHKYDGSGATQLFNARVENGKWVPHQTTNWSTRWQFSGMNTLTFEIEVDGVKVHPDGKLKQLYYNMQNGGWGGLLLDEATLASTAVIPPPYPYPAELNAVESSYYGMRTRWGTDAGSGPDPDIYYMMRWETLDPNGDQKREPEPPSTTLRVYGFRRSAMKLLN